MVYPTQYDAETMLELQQKLHEISTSGCSIWVRDFINKIDEDRAELHAIVFGETSPWTVATKRNKRVVAWDEDKAKKLI